MKTNQTVSQPKKALILHGECMVYQSAIPLSAEELDVPGDYLIVADSETSGNHHVIDRTDGVKFYRHLERRFMRNTEPTQIRCLHEHRHDAIVLEPGQWEFGTQMEYDPFARLLRRVWD